MICRLMSFTLPAFLLSLVSSTFAAPIASDFEADHTTSLTTESDLSPRTTHSGRGTYFFPGLGNCGQTNGSEDPIVAVSTQIYNDGANCDQWVHITNTANGKTTYAKVRDSCPSCTAGSLDMSPATFQEMAPLSEGVIPIQWHYMNRDFNGP